MTGREHLDVDLPCGRHFKYRDLVECGKTWREHAVRGEAIDNLPSQRDSLRALRELCLEILDPVIETFGRIELTYGFSSLRLARRVPGGIAPALDQHAAHETGRTGRPVCRRLGAAVDFRIPGISSLLVARWIVDRLPFDRLYYYGARRPLHVSVGPDQSRAVVVMATTPDGRRFPKATGAAALATPGDPRKSKRRATVRS
jgi:hypothetical protein